MPFGVGRVASGSSSTVISADDIVATGKLFPDLVFYPATMLLTTNRTQEKCTSDAAEAMQIEPDAKCLVLTTEQWQRRVRGSRLAAVPPLATE